MSYLTARAEHALIGAMLTDRPLPEEFAHLRADSFGHRVTRELYTTITQLRDTVRPAQLPDAVADRLHASPITATWLRKLRDDCPQPAHIAAYARMIQVAAFRRDIAREAERIAAIPPGQKTANTDRLTAALTRQTQVFQAFTAIDERDATPTPTHPAPEPSAPHATTARAVREDQLLADLLAHPEQASDLARIVPPDAFTSEQRREVFMTIVTLAADGDPVDEIIVAWQFQQLRALADLYGDTTPTHDSEEHDGSDLTYRGDETSPEPTPAYLARLATTDVAGESAISIGYQLIVEDARARLAQAATDSVQRQTANQQPPQPRPGPPPAQHPALQPPAIEQPSAQPRIDQ